MDFVEYLEKTKSQIDSELAVIFKKKQSEFKKINPKLGKLFTEFVKASRGGKRIRGALVRLGYEIALDSGGVKTSQNDILKVAAAYEIFQTAILAHDDLIDKSEIRRGKPSLYKSLGGNHYALSQTISLGDMGFFLATDLITNSNFPENLKNKALSFFSKTMLETTLGQMLDVEKGDALTISKLKTAGYSFSGPLILGSIFGNGNNTLIKTLMNFGENLGMAFQIQDDIMGVFGSEKETGKSTTSDIEENKKTLLLEFALKNGTPSQKEYLKKNYGKGKITLHQFLQIKKILIDSKALVLTRQLAIKYVFKAKKIIPQLSKDPMQKQIFGQLSDYLVERKS